MKLNTIKNNLQTNAEFESKDFGIGDPSVVIEILRNRLYAHPIRTLVQEYISNGRDAIRESGKKGKLLVQAPTMFLPTFKVRDFGVGISPERMNDVFVMYGSSTKRKTNNQTGGFGIGAKSAWSYTDSFTITTFVDGIKREYVAHVGANSNGRLDLLNTSETDEPNGTEIQIAVSKNDIFEFHNAIRRCVFFWSEDEKPEILGLNQNQDPHKIESVKISDDIEVFKNLPNFIDDNGLHVVVDGIVYTVDNSFVKKNEELQKFMGLFSYNTDVAVKMPNGIVEVSASREKLADSDRTKKALAAMAEKWHKQTTEYYKSHFKACNTLFDFVKTYRTFEGVIEKTKLQNQFKGYSVDHSSVRHDKFTKVNFVKVSPAFGRRNRRNNTSNHKDDVGLNKIDVTSIPVHLMENIFFVDTNESKILLNKRIRELLKVRAELLLVERKSPTPMPKANPAGDVHQEALMAWNKLQPMPEPDLQEFLSEIQAQKISNTPIPEVTKEEKERARKDKGVISVHKASWNQSIKDVDLNFNEQTYIYANLEYDRHMIAELKDFVEKETGAVLCRLSNAAIKKVQNDTNFSKLEDFIAKVKVTKEMRIAQMNAIAKNKDIVADLMAIKKHITSKEVLEVLDAYKAFELKDKEKYMRIPSALGEMINGDKEVQEFQKLDDNFSKLLKTKYLLTTQIDFGEYADKEVQKEVANYINSK